MVLVGWLDHPHVLLAVLGWNFFFVGVAAASLQVLVSLHKLVVLVRIQVRADDEGRGRRIKNLIPIFNSILIVFVEHLETSDEACLGRDLPVVFQMTDHQFLGHVEVERGVLEIVEAVVDLLLQHECLLLGKEAFV